MPPVNDDFVNKYTVQAAANADSLGLADKALAATAGVVVSAGVNTWNSLVSIPNLVGIDTEGMKAGTYDVLRNVNQNWGNFYTDNRDAIETASFIAGSLLPAGLALKGMKALQAGKFGIYPAIIDDASQLRRQSDLYSMLSNASQNTSAYRALKNQILWADAGQQVGLALGMEVATVAVMNQSPLMEDYIKDPTKNFLISMTFGSVLGAGIGQAILRNQLANGLSDIMGKSINLTRDVVHEKPLNIAGIDEYQRYVYNAQELRKMADDTEQLPLTRELAKEQATIWESRAGQLRNDSIYGPGLKGLDAKSADTAIIQKTVNDVISSPYSYGANTVDIIPFNPKEISNLAKMAPGDEMRIQNQVAKALEEGFVNSAEAGEITKILREAAARRLSLDATEALKKPPEWETLMKHQTKKGVPTPQNAYYSPVFGTWADSKIVPQILHAVDVGIERAQKINTVGRLSDEGAEIILDRARSTAFADAYYINSLHTVNTYDLARGNTVHIPDGDIAVAQAWLSRINSMPIEDRPLIKLVSVPALEGNVSQSAIKASGREIDLAELQRYVASSKEQAIRDLSAQGAGAQEISIRTNMPVDTVEKWLISGQSIVDAGQWMTYTDARQIPAYLSKTKATLTFTTNEKKLQSTVLRNADMSAKLDAASITKANEEVLSVAMADSSSSTARTFYKELLSYKQDWDIIREGLAQINNENVGSIMANSADFYLRRTGKTGETAIVLGQTMTNIINRLSEEQLKPVVAKIRAHTSSQVGNNEFNKIINILAGTSGYRNIDESGRLYKLVDSPKPWFGARTDANGLPVQVAKPELVKEYLTDLDGTALFITDGMKAILKDFSGLAKEQFALHNTINKILGYKEMNDIGLHIPSFNPRNKFISYIIDREATQPNERVRLLVGKNAEHLADLEADWKAKFGMSDKRYELIGPKSRQEDFNFWHQRVSPLDMDFADATKFHSGASAQFNVPLDDAYAQTIIDNLHGRFIYYSKKLQNIYLSDVMDNLDVLSDINRRFTDKQPTLARTFALNQPTDSARAFKNILMGNSQLDASQSWQIVNNGFSSMIDWTVQKLAKPLESFASAVSEGKYGAKAAWYKLNGSSKDEVTYKGLSQQLEQSGLRNPFKDFSDYIAFKNGGTDEQVAAIFQTNKMESPEIRQRFATQLEQLKVQETARRLGVSESKAEEYIAAGSSLLTMTALRVLETGHAFVTAISWPIMTLPNLYRDFAKTHIGQGQEVMFPAKLIYDGIRFRMGQAGAGKVKQWTEEGFAESVVSEVQALQNHISTGGKGAVAAIDKLVNSDLVNTLSKPSQFAEKESRLWSLSVGYLAAKQAFPGISERNADMYAKAFLARTIGNYYSGQRPALFQGSLGTTIGLFQTYMLTWAQNAYRSIETKDLKALSAQMLSQAGLFGMSSLPGYQMFSQAIGSHFSDEHFDLTTGTYRAIPEPLADFVIHGLPASLGVGLYTRGGIQPRLPFGQDNMLDTIAAVNVARQTYAATAGALTNALNANGMADKSRAILEGLSIQSLSRPIARIVELTPQYNQETGTVEALGSTTREGNTVGTSSMVWSVPGVLSRVLSSRSSEEQIKRDMIYLSSFYGALDSQNRKEAAHAMKISLRNGSLTSDKLDIVAERYLRSGTASGFRSALNEAMSTTEGGVDYTLGKKLRDGSPFMQMVDHGW